MKSTKSKKKKEKRKKKKEKNQKFSVRIQIKKFPAKIQNAGHP